MAFGYKLVETLVSNLVFSLSEPLLASYYVRYKRELTIILFIVLVNNFYRVVAFKNSTDVAYNKS